MIKVCLITVQMLLVIGLEELCAQNIDYQLIEKLQAGRTATSDKFYASFDMTADVIGIATPVALGARYLSQKNEANKLDFISSCVSTVGTYGVAYVLKKTIDRDRPFYTYPVFTPYTYKTSGSMPSGSTSIAFTSATNLTLSFKKWYVAVPAYTYATMVGFSRVRLAEHYPSDVAAGAVLGVGSVLISRKLNQWINR